LGSRFEFSSDLYKAVQLVSEGSVLKEMEYEMPGGTVKPWFTWKMEAAMVMVVALPSRCFKALKDC